MALNLFISVDISMMIKHIDSLTWFWYYLFIVKMTWCSFSPYFYGFTIILLFNITFCDYQNVLFQDFALSQGEDLKYC